MFVTPSVVTVVPDVVVPTTAYVAPAPVYAPPAYMPPAYAPAPSYAGPRIVELPTGRYELRGDGTYTPYTWVWIPNPPPAAPEPVVPPPPTAPPAASPEPRRTPARVYRWTDDNGVTTWTDAIEKIPARYRAQASQLAP